MNNNFFSNKWVKWIVGILAALLILLLATTLYINAYWKPILTEKVKDAVSKGSNGLYKIDFSDAHINLVSGNLTLDSIQLSPDSMVYDSLKLLRKAPAHVFEVKVAKLQLSRIAILTAYFKRHIKINTLLLEKPSINMMFSKVRKRVDAEKGEKTLYQLISKDIKLLQVKNIKIVDADFAYFDKLKSNKSLNSIQKLNVLVNDFLIDSVSETDPKRYFYSKNVQYSVIGYRSITKDKMYEIKLDTLQGNAHSENLRVVGFKMIPQFNELDFSRKYNVQKDRYDLVFKKIEAKGFDLRTLINDGVLKVKTMVIGPAKVNVFMNRELPPPNFNKGKNFPHLALKRLAIPTTVDTLELKNIDVAYTEYSEETQKKGTIELAKIRGKILHVSNDSTELTKNSHAHADLVTHVMGTGFLKLKIDFYLTNANGRFDYSGTLDKMDLRVLNPLSVNLGMIRLESGLVNKLKFNASADYNGVNGNLTMLYSNLKVEMLRKEDNKIKKKGLLSFLANNVLIIADNPKNAKSDVRHAKIDYERPMTSSFFNLLWKGIFTGIRETVGIGMIPMKNPPKPKQQ